MSRSTGWTSVIRISIVLSMLFIAKASNVEEATRMMMCDEARYKCAYRTGCGHALQFYMTQCMSVLQGEGTECPESCQHALIALTSTNEGKELMTTSNMESMWILRGGTFRRRFHVDSTSNLRVLECECAPDDGMCKQSKQRVEICRSSVMLAMNRTRVSCRIATWICHADIECLTALNYYNLYCKSMFAGRKCTSRCKNSISILRRQEKADKLNSCICDGEEEFDCRRIHRNMNLLCHKKSVKLDTGETKNPDTTIQTNEILKDHPKVDNSGLQIQADKTLSFIMVLFILFMTKD